MMLELPLPIQLVIDDVGWREGWDISASGGPFRAGVDRLLGADDYRAVITLGTALGVRPQCAMVLCEWDRENVCARYPTTTAAGPAWDNAQRIGPWLDATVDLFRRHAPHIDFAMHGVGHEHWEQGIRTRAEWLGGSAQQRWPQEVLRGHLACFRQILRQQGLASETGVSWPRSFVPCAFRFLWDDEDPASSGAFMSAAGIHYASTPFSSCCFAGASPQAVDGGFEHDLIVLDRGNSGVPWHAYDTLPKAFPNTAICGIHWPNLLRPDPDDNATAVQRWIAFLRTAGEQPGRYLAHNMAETCSQWVYCRFASLKQTGPGRWCIDTSHLPERAAPRLMPLVLRCRQGAVRGIQLHPVDPYSRIVATWDQGEDRFHALLPLHRGRMLVEQRDASAPLPAVQPWVARQGTFDVLDVAAAAEGGWTLRLRCYGSQEVILILPDDTGPPQVTKIRGGRSLTLRREPAEGHERLHLGIESTDIQGEEIVLHVSGLTATP